MLLSYDFCGSCDLLVGARGCRSEGEQFSGLNFRVLSALMLVLVLNSAGTSASADDAHLDQPFVMLSSSSLHISPSLLSRCSCVVFVGVAKADEISFSKQEAEKCRRRAEAAKKQKDNLQGEQGSVQAQLSQQVLYLKHASFLFLPWRLSALLDCSAFVLYTYLESRGRG